MEEGHSRQILSETGDLSKCGTSGEHLSNFVMGVCGRVAGDEAEKVLPSFNFILCSCLLLDI